ncbi:protein transport protein bet1 [Agyrium rufum]|nr:protein transport protein bet1 [Agyrium rufum]
MGLTCDLADHASSPSGNSRFGPSALHQRDARSQLFENYRGGASRGGAQGGSSRPSSQSPARFGGNGSGHSNANGYGYAASMGGTGASGSGGINGGFRAATPNSRGQYNDAVLDELESQNDQQVEGMSAKVRMLKDLTVKIGDEIRDSSKLADSMNDTFDSTRVRLKGTMNRMLRMAEKTGVGWRVWLMFFAAVIFVFWYVWLF